MKKNSFFLLLLVTLLTISAKAQENQALTKSNYSRWSVGVNGGMPFYWGDFKSFSADKNYYGIGGGLQLTYQISSMFGITLSGDYGQNKAGTQDHSRNYLLDNSGFTYYTPQEGKTTATYESLYSKVRMLSLGAGVDVNVLRLFTANPNRRFAILLTPTAWVQKYYTDVYFKSNDDKFVTDHGKRNWHFALGGSLSLRYRLNKLLDIQLKNTFAYIYNDKFDGISNHPFTRQNYMWEPQLGVVVKFGNTKSSGRVDNMLYYGKTEAAPVVEPEPIVEEATVVEKKEEPQPVKVEPKPEVQPQKVEIPALPKIYFDFNHWNIKTQEQSSDLKTIVDAANKFSDCPIVLEGYADRRGGKRINDIISKRRADAVKAYLIKKGIDANRISSQGCGKDLSVSDKLARRVEIQLTDK